MKMKIKVITFVLVIIGAVVFLHIQFFAPLSKEWTELEKELAENSSKYQDIVGGNSDVDLAKIYKYLKNYLGELIKC